LPDTLPQPVMQALSGLPRSGLACLRHHLYRHHHRQSIPYHFPPSPLNPGASPARCLAMTRKRPPTGAGRASPLLNEAVARLQRVRLISEDGADRGEMSGRDAYDAAREAGRDVLVVHASPAGRPCVVRLLNYAKAEEAARRSAYDSRKKEREVKREDRKAGVTKQVRLSPAIGERDFGMKMRQARRFLVEGHRVRVFMMFRRGQGRMQDDAKVALTRAANALAEYGVHAGVKAGKARRVDAEHEFTAEELFPKVELDEEEKVGAARQKPPQLDVLFTPVKKSERERLKARLAGELRAERGGGDEDEEDDGNDCGEEEAVSEERGR
jgi:translation initiation factor IF-3